MRPSASFDRATPFDIGAHRCSTVDISRGGADDTNQRFAKVVDLLAISADPSRISAARRPVSIASFDTLTIWLATSRAACVNSSTVRDISSVTAFCFSMADAICEETEFDASDDVADRADRVNQFPGRLLDFADLLGDLAGRFRGLLGQRFHFRCHHGKAAAGLAGAGRLDRGVKSQ